MYSTSELKEGMITEDSRLVLNASMRVTVEIEPSEYRVFVIPHLSARLRSDRFRPLVALGVWYLALGLVLRLVLWWSFGRAQQVAAAELPWIVSRGLASDAMQALFLLLPFAICLWLTPDRLRHPRWHRVALIVASFAWMFGLTFVAAIE